MSVGGCMGGTPVVALGNIVLLSEDRCASIVQRHENRRGRMIAARAALRATDADGAVPVEPYRQINRLKIGLAVDHLKRHTYGVGFQIAVTLVGKPPPVQDIATIAPFAHIAPPEPCAWCAVFGDPGHENSSN